MEGDSGIASLGLCVYKNAATMERRSRNNLFLSSSFNPCFNFLNKQISYSSYTLLHFLFLLQAPGRSDKFFVGISLSDCKTGEVEKGTRKGERP